MKKIILSTMIGISFVASATENFEILASNIYKRVDAVFHEDGGLGTRRLFGGVAGGDGFMWGSLQQPFLELVPVISNNYVQIAEDWDVYQTNRVVSFTIISAIGFSGFNVYTNFLETMLSRYEQAQTSNNWEVVRHLLLPINTPLEKGLLLNNDNVAVSNMILRIKTGAIQRSDNKINRLCERFISSEARRRYLDMIEMGVEK
jgi:hypothetical protein